MIHRPPIPTLIVNKPLTTLYPAQATQASEMAKDTARKITSDADTMAKCSEPVGSSQSELVALKIEPE